MRKALALLSALCLALGTASCGQEPEQPPEATAPPEYYDAGTEAAQSGDYAAAVDAFSRAIEADDGRAAAYAGRADCYIALDGSGDKGDSPDLRGLAILDYETALELDPKQGPHIYEVCAAIGAEALAAGSTDEALRYLRVAYDTAGDEKADEIAKQVTGITDRFVVDSVWYMDAPDSRYYEFFSDGTGRVVDAAAMEPAGRVTWENAGFELTVKGKDGPGTWTYEPGQGSYYAAIPRAEGETLSLRLERSSLRRMYTRWQEDILGAEAELRLNGTSEEDQTAQYTALYEREYALAQALAVSGAGTLTEEDTALLTAEREDGSTAQDAFGQLRAAVDTLLTRLPDTAAAESGSALGEMFPVGGQTLLDYLRLTVKWVLTGRELSAPDGGKAAAWDELGDVDHYFRGGRLYLRLHGYALQKGETGYALAADAYGEYTVKTPLSFGDDVALAGEELLSRLRESDWIGLWDSDYGPEVFFLELELADDMTCTARGGHYPGQPAGTQSGEHTLSGNTLTLTLSAEGYASDTYRYEVLPMGDSLYMTLLTDGAVYGQTAGSASVFCGGSYASGVRASIG